MPATLKKSARKTRTVHPSGAATGDRPVESIAGKTVLVAGGTTGIGRATAALLCRLGARVVIFGRDRADLERALSTIRPTGEVHGLSADQSRQGDVDRVFAAVDEKFKRLDVLVNCAAVTCETLDRGTFEDFRNCVDVNLLGYIACTQQALRRMRKQTERGHIVHIGSMSADLREAGNPVYVATKSGIQAFSESLRKSANKDRISVTLIEPGAVATPLQEKSRAEEARRIRAMRMLEPDDIAECVHYCLVRPKRCNIVSMQIRPLKQLI